MKIAIPTLGRPKNLTTLKIANEIFGEDNVIVFFHNQKEQEDYLKNYKIKHSIVTNKPRGIAGQRNAILDSFKKGEEIIMLNDDIKGFYELINGALKKLTPEEARKEFENCFKICHYNDCKLFGFYPVKNHFFMNNKVTNKGFIVGTLMGIIVSDLRFDEKFHTKEDYDFTIKNIIRHKKVARFNYLVPDAKHQEKEGGCGYVFNDNTYDKDFRRIIEKWPAFVRVNPKRKNEILLR